MRRRLVLVPLAFGVAMSALGALGERMTNAAAVQTCTYNETWTFNPPLTTALVTGGQAILNGTWHCVKATASGAVGETSGSADPNNSTFIYNGSCLAASLSGPFSQTGELVGGSTILLHAVGGLTDNTSVTALVLQPNAICNESSTVRAVGAGEGVFMP